EEGIRHPGRRLDPRSLARALRGAVQRPRARGLGSFRAAIRPGAVAPPPARRSRPAQAALDAGHVPALAASLGQGLRGAPAGGVMRVLVTGGAGFIGSHLCAHLLARGDEVTAVDNFDPFYPERLKRRAIEPLLRSAMRLVTGDIRDEAAMEGAFRESRPETIVHLAALARVRPSRERPTAYMDVNVRGATVLLDAARKANVRRFIFGSSSSVYGEGAEPPFRETARIDSPLSPYAASKAAGELLARTFHNLYGT